MDVWTEQDERNLQSMMARKRETQERQSDVLNGSWAGAFGHTQFMPSTYQRIAVDWGDESAAHRNIACDTMIDARVVKPIDTSTTAGKIAVMQAYDRGEAVQAKVAGRNYWSLPRKRSDTGDGPCWDWTLYDYRIAPPEPTGTALDAAREYMRDTPPTGDTADQKLRDLVKYIRSCPVDEIRGTIGLSVQPGRYRLVPDPE